jgi:hypothetical protein
MLSPKEQNIESIIADVCEVQRLVVMKFVLVAMVTGLRTNLDYITSN